MRLKTKFRDRNDTTEQVYGSKWVISKFRDRDDTAEQIWEPNGRFVNLETGMAQHNRTFLGMNFTLVYIKKTAQVLRAIGIAY